MRYCFYKSVPCGLMSPTIDGRDKAITGSYTAGLGSMIGHMGLHARHLRTLAS